ncbi:hypothetical protein ACLMJK_004681 [Lecanora helva]
METPALNQHCKVWAKPKPYTTYEWVEELPKLFRDENLEAVTSDRHVVGDQYRGIWGQSNLAGYVDLVEENVEGVGNAGDMRQIVKVLEAEMKKGASFNTTFMCVGGKRA